MLRPSPWGVLPLLLGGLLASAAGLGGEEPWDLAAPRPAIGLRPERLEDLRDETCGGCHADVVAEWAGTAHAVAWVDEVYREAIADRTRPEACHGCHVPEPLLEEGPPRRPLPRQEDRHLGVSCLACHLGPGGSILGPLGLPTEAHPTAASEFLARPRSSELCAACHATSIGPVLGVAKDFFEAGMEQRGRSCVGCHMAPVEREPAMGSPQGTAPRAGRSHALQTPRDPAFLARAFETRLLAGDGRRTVLVRNVAGHRVPGMIGRRIELAVEPLDSAGRAGAARSLVLEGRSGIAVDGSAEIEVDAGSERVRLRGTHRDPRSPEPAIFLDVVLEPEHR